MQLRNLPLVPALLIRMITMPKVLTAVFMTTAPSVNNDMLRTAFPQSKFQWLVVTWWHHKLGGIPLTISCVQQQHWSRSQQCLRLMKQGEVNNYSQRTHNLDLQGMTAEVTYAFPNALPAPVMTTMWPSNYFETLVWRSWWCWEASKGSWLYVYHPHEILTFTT